MIRFAIVLILIIVILLVIRSRSNNFSQNTYKKIIMDDFLLDEEP